MKKLFLIFFALLPVVLFTGCSNYPSPRQVAKYNQIDSEASTNLGAIFTDETAFNATNSLYISAGTSSEAATVPQATVVSSVHAFYDTKLTAGKGTYNVDTAPFTCVAGVLTAVGGYNTYTAGVATNTSGPATANGGFADIGFLPQGSLYFYYGVAINSTASLSAPTAQQAATWPLTYNATSVAGGATVSTANVNGSCGGGYEAFAGTNFTGSNYQIYAVDDFTSKAALISGVAY